MGIGMMFQERGEPSGMGERPGGGGGMRSALPLGLRPHPSPMAGG